jgi:cytochrome c-type biogenesis protein CcsB
MDINPMKHITNTLFSMKLTAFLLLTLAFASGTATFIENDFGTISAQAVIYNALWFEIVIGILMINLIGNMYRFKMYKRAKWAHFIFHLSLIVIIVGAAMTRYMGHEGMMHIREAATSNTITSTKTYITITSGSASYEYPVLFSTLTNNNFDVTIDGVTFNVSEFYQYAAEQLVEEAGAKPYIELMVANGGQPQTLNLSYGEAIDIGGIALTFADENQALMGNYVHIQRKGNSFIYHSSIASEKMGMADGIKHDITAKTEEAFVTKNLYSFGQMKLVPKTLLLGATKKIVNMKKKTGISALKMQASINDENKEMILWGASGVIGKATNFTLNNKTFSIAYGAKTITLPFGIKLNAFALDRYAGSNSPSSYSSHVGIVDDASSKPEPFHIYMNHILVHKNYRLYQSSYDQDELGTVLQVTKDPGMEMTYLGYFLMTFGLIWMMFSKSGRFKKLTKAVNKSTASTLIAATLLLANATPSFSVDINQAHADAFSKLLTQDVGGRIKPVNTLAVEFLNKVHRKGSFSTLNANQVVLGMLATPEAWQTVPFIKIGHNDIAKLLGKDGEKYLAFNDFFEQGDMSHYILKSHIEEVSRTRPADRGTFDKELLKVDERANICFMLFRGELFKIFPKPDSSETKWYSPIEALQNFPESQRAEIQKLTMGYLTAVSQAIVNGGWEEADQILKEITAYQYKHGSNIIPHANVIKAELVFNELNIFIRLAPLYAIAGFILLFLLIGKIFKPTLSTTLAIRILMGIMIFGFIAHTAGLGLRWYISGHAPWSNGYESLIYIAWATMLAGLLFSGRSMMTLSATGIISAMTLGVAHLSWMDPQITNLVPVLKSYWLTIHVSIISGSYGFLALGALLGFITMILFIFRSPTHPQVDRSINELIKVGEMTIMVGISMITIGNMFGAVWANESWGRYWSWDAKETWTLVSILIYASIIHLRMIPKMPSAYLFALLSTVAFSSIIMTYFGVNFYLSGLHSYAAGDPVPIPDFVYYTIAIVTVIALLAFRKRDRVIPLTK